MTEERRHTMTLTVRLSQWPEPRHWLIPCEAEDPRRITPGEAEYLLGHGFYGVMTPEDR